MTLTQLFGYPTFYRTWVQLFLFSQLLKLLGQAIYEDDAEDEREPTESVDEDSATPVTPDVPRKGSVMKPPSGKGQKSQKTVAGADMLTVTEDGFDMQFSFQRSTPHIILAEVTSWTLLLLCSYLLMWMFHVLVGDEARFLRCTLHLLGSIGGVLRHPAFWISASELAFYSVFRSWLPTIDVESTSPIRS